MGGPRRALVGTDMDDNLTPGRSKRRFTEIKNAVNHCVGTDPRIETGGTEEVEGDDGMGEEEIPSVLWKILVSAVEDGNKMIFESLDGAFSRITAMVPGGNQLIVERFVLLNDTDKFVRNLVIELEKLGGETSKFQFAITKLEASDDLLFLA